MIPILCNLFNVILDSGIFPENWCNSTIIPVFKKGDENDVNNYRGITLMSHFSFQPVLHNWCNKGRGMCYPVCGMVHIKEPLLLIGKSSPCGGSGFPLSRYLSGPLPYV